MYKKIIVPVDLAHAGKLMKALKTAADLARHYQAPVCYVGVTTATPGSLAHNPAEYTTKLEAFARTQGEENGIETSSHTVVAHDPTIDLDDALLKAITRPAADLVVMATHVPNVADHLWPSNGGTSPTLRTPPSSSSARVDRHRRRKSNPNNKGRDTHERSSTAQGIPAPEGRADLIETDYEIGQDNIEPTSAPSASTSTIRSS
jgi:nucleotide-binding universal stress UspA family protein